MDLLHRRAAHVDRSVLNPPVVNLRSHGRIEIPVPHSFHDGRPAFLPCVDRNPPAEAIALLRFPVGIVIFRFYPQHVKGFMSHHAGRGPGSAGIEGLALQVLQGRNPRVLCHTDLNGRALIIPENSEILKRFLKGAAGPRITLIVRVGNAVGYGNLPRPQLLGIIHIPARLRNRNIQFR